MVAHAAERQLAERRVGPAPDALDAHRGGGPVGAQHGQRRVGVEDRVLRGVRAHQDVVEHVDLRVDVQVLGDRQRRLEAQAHVRVRLRVVVAGVDERPREQVVARGVLAALQVHVVEELEPPAQVPVRLEEVDAGLERLDRLAVPHARGGVLLDPLGLLLGLLARLLQLLADLLHHLAAELLRVDGGSRRRHRRGHGRRCGRERGCGGDWRRGLGRLGGFGLGGVLLGFGRGLLLGWNGSLRRSLGGGRVLLGLGGGGGEQQGAEGEETSHRLSLG